MAWYEGDAELVVGGTFTKLHLRVVARTAFGQSIHVSGSSFTLGKYNPSEALPLVTTPEEYPVWRTLKPIIQIRDLALLQRASLSVVAGGGGASVPRNSFASGMPLVRSSKTATAQGKSRAGSKAAVALSSSDETAIEKACVDLCADALTKRRSSDSFEEDFRAEIKAIFIDTVRELREGAR